MTRNATQVAHWKQQLQQDDLPEDSNLNDRDRSTSSSTTLSSTLPPPSSSPSSPTVNDTLQISRFGEAAAAAGEKMDGSGSNLACFARNPLTASLNVPAAPQSPAAGKPAKSRASTRALALFSGRSFTTISPSASVGSTQICHLNVVFLAVD